ncbi:MAG: ribonuclease R [Bdellovibrionales bacterium]|nr:ribonuclease R [Bdellovibrionales bacterium]
MSRPKHKHKGNLLGTVQKNPRGFAFVIPDDTSRPDAYIDRKQARRLMNKDRIRFRYEKRAGRVSALVDKVVERGQSVVLGQVERFGSSLSLNTSDGDFPISGNPKKIHPGDWVSARVVQYPDNRHAGKVEVEEYFGDRLRPTHDYRIAINRYSLSESFSRAELAESEFVAEQMDDPEERRHRKDLRDLPLVTIDGEDAKDFDDAVAVTSEDFGFRLYVAIADVSFFVKTGSLLDKAALQRGTSVYFPGRCLPMLPEVLSNNVCSLRPGEERFALTAEIDIDRRGEFLRSDFYSSLIQTHARLTYNQVHGYWKEKKKDLEGLKRPLDNMIGLFRILRQSRQARGVLDFDLPECKVELDSDGIPTHCAPAARHKSHQLIEEFMIAANRVVARKLRESKKAGMYRVHEPPDREGVDEVNQMLRNLGIGESIHKITPKAFAKVLEHSHNVPGGHTLHTVILRAQKQARYLPDPLGHFGLALRDYTHFTSPIRRYPDLIVHRLLKRLIGEAKSTDKKYEEGQLMNIARDCSNQERNAMEAERFVVRRKQCWYMQQHLGDRFHAVVSWVAAEGLYMEIPELAVEGFLPVETLRGFYEYDSRKLAFVKRPGKERLGVGTKLDVIVDEISVEQGKIWFSQA